MPRLFTAIALGANARDKIAAEQKRLMTEMRGADIRWVQPEHMHLTLVFIGQVSDDAAASIVGAMREPIRQTAFQVEYAQIGVFPPHGAPRVLWVGVGGGADQVVEVHRFISTRLGQFGVELEARTFSPHLTLGRWRGRGGRRSERPCDTGPAGTIAVDEIRFVTLFLSKPTTAGPSYSVLANTPLVAAASPVH